MENHRSLFHHVLPAEDSFGRAGVFWFYPSFGNGSPSAICISYQPLPARRERTLETDSDIVCCPLEILVQVRPNTCADRIYGGAYQGIGVSLTTFGDKKQLGDPFSFYVFQGARIAVSLPVPRSIMSGISVCPPDGSHTTIIIIPIMVRSVHG